MFRLIMFINPTKIKIYTVFIYFVKVRAMTGIDKYEIISFYLIFISMRKNGILKHFFL